jgi:hypothetical protein
MEHVQNILKDQKDLAKYHLKAANHDITYYRSVIAKGGSDRLLKERTLEKIAKLEKEIKELEETLEELVFLEDLLSKADVSEIFKKHRRVGA